LLIGLGLWWATATRAAGEPPPYAIERATFESAILIANTGTTDLEISSLADASQLAVGKFSAVRGPGFAGGGKQARVELTRRQAQPWLPGRRWSAALTTGLPWTLDVKSWTGNLDLDLTEVRLEALRLRSTFGDVVLSLPANGQSSVDVRLLAGNLKLRVPDKLAVRVKVRRGPLATVSPDERRLVQLAPGEWASPLYAVSADRCSVTIDAWGGDLDVE
jgi:hypothetical protein